MEGIGKDAVNSVGDKMLSVNIAAQLAKFGADKWTENGYDDGRNHSDWTGTNRAYNCSSKTYATAIDDVIEASISREYCPCWDAKDKLPEEYVLVVTHNILSQKTSRTFRGDHIKALFDSVQSSRKAQLEAKKRREEEEFADRLRIFARNG